MVKVKQARESLLKAIAIGEQDARTKSELKSSTAKGRECFKGWDELVEKYWRMVREVDQWDVLSTWSYFLNLQIFNFNLCD